jgi:phage/plasmid-associated DNA primase
MPAFPGGIGHEIRRRVLILTFNHTIMKEERDETVERLAETHPNEFLAAIVEGASRYIRQGDFTLPASSAEAMTEWLGEEKLVAALTADGYIVPPKRTEPDRLQLLLRRQAAKGK